MNDFDFDKSFSDDLRRERFEEPADQNWERLAASLDGLDRRRAWRKRLFLGGLPLLIATGLAVFFSSKWQAADQRADRLETRVCELERQVFLEKKAVEAPVFSTEIATDRPTRSNVAKTQNGFAPAGLNVDRNAPHPVFKSLGEAKSNSRQADFAPPGLAENSSGSFLPTSSPSGAAVVLSGADDFSKKETAAPSVFSTENGQPGSELTIDFSQKEAAAPGVSSIEKWMELPRNSPKPIDFQRKMADWPMFSPPFKLTDGPIRPVKTRRFSAGLSVGFVAANGHQNAPGGGGMVGLDAQFLLKKGWRLTGGIEKNRLFFESKFGSFPDVPPPPNAGDVFSGVDGSRSEMAVLLGVRRQFRVEKRLQPFVSLAWAGVQPLETEMEFHFLNPVSGKRSSLRLPSESSDHFDAANLRLSLGGSWKFRRRLEMNLQTGWQQSLGHSKNGEPEGQFSMSASLFRLF